MFRLTDPDHINLLVGKSETGMGYQLVEGVINGRENRFFAFNCELLLGIEEQSDYFPPETALKEIPPVRDFVFGELVPLSAMEAPTGGLGAPAGPFAPSPRIFRKTVDYEGFARVSAFPNDHRVTPNGGLVDGTFATTVADLLLVPSGFAAAGRYALPNPAAAKYVYIVVPGADNDIDGGTVRPAHHQAGGGVEVNFVNGAPDGSVVNPYRIPEL